MAGPVSSCIKCLLIYNICIMAAKKHSKSLAVCMIVKNEEAVIPKTLPNAVRYSDRVILADTGSTDNTAAVAKGYGAEVYGFEWINDFSAARNFSCSKAREDWILWLDADEYMDEASFSALRDLLDNTEADVINIPIYECKYGTADGTSFYMRGKIFRNNKGARFVKPVNEQLVFPDGSRPSYDDFRDARICHWGLDLPSGTMAKKMETRIELLKQTAAAAPEDFAVRYLLGLRCSEIGRPEEAIDHYSQVISICEKDASSDKTKKAFAHAAHAKKAQLLLKSGNAGQALAEALSAIQLDPLFLEPCDSAVMALLELGKYDEALQLSEQMLKLPKIQHPVLLFNQQKWDSLIYVLHIRALLKAKGKKEALYFAEKALADHPDNPVLRQSLNALKGPAQRQ